MKWPRVRISTLMLLVVVAGLAFVAGMLAERWKTGPVPWRTNRLSVPDPHAMDFPTNGERSDKSVSSP